MTPEKARKWVDHIDAISADDEMAHSVEDESRMAFLMALKNGEIDSIEEAAQIASILLESDNISFARWCA